MQFEHTSGDPLPSTLPSYRSLAEALVAGDAAGFTPRTPNAGYTPHAKSLEAHAADNEDEDESEDDESDETDD